MFLQVFHFWWIVSPCSSGKSFIYVHVCVCCTVYMGCMYSVCCICVCVSTYAGNTPMNCFTLLVNLIFVIINWPSWSLIILFCLKMMPHKVSRALALEVGTFIPRMSQCITSWERPGESRENSLPLYSLDYLAAFCPTSMMSGFSFSSRSVIIYLFLQLNFKCSNLIHSSGVNSSKQAPYSICSILSWTAAGQCQASCPYKLLFQMRLLTKTTFVEFVFL